MWMCAHAFVYDFWPPVATDDDSMHTVKEEWTMENGIATKSEYFGNGKHWGNFAFWTISCSVHRILD